MNHTRSYFDQRVVHLALATLGIQAMIVLYGVVLNWRGDASAPQITTAQLDQAAAPTEVERQQREEFIRESLLQVPPEEAEIPAAAERKIEESSASHAKEAAPQAPAAAVNTAPQTAPDTTSAEAAPVEHVRVRRLTKYVVQSGETLTKIWVNNGGSYQGGLRAAKALEEVKIPVSAFQAGDQLELGRSAEGDIISLRKRLRDGRTLILEGDSKIGYSAKINDAKVVEVKRTATGTILNSFSDAAVQAHVPYAVVDDLVDLFSTRLEFRTDLHEGDSFTVIYTERRTPDGRRLEPGPILAASFANQDQLLVALRHVDSDGVARYYDQAGHPLGNFFLRYPLKFSRISSMFSKSRFHPVLGRPRPHNGIDFAAPLGTPVRAVADGVVMDAGLRGEAGKMIKIAHGDRYASAYLHLASIAPGITRNARVSRGEVIGQVGMTGLATGPHLHYSFYDRGQYVDPLLVKLPLTPEKNSSVPNQFLQATLRALTRQHETIRIASLLTQESHIG